jgi:uncharacterized protein YkwD
MKYLKHITKYFIPGKHNQYKPHFFRVEAVFAMAGVIAFLFVAAAALNTLVIRSGSLQLGAVVSSTLVELTNADRAGNGLGDLAVNPVLQKAAQMKADDMAAKGYFAHNSPEGITPWHWFKEAGYGFSFAGENLAVYFSDSAELERAWMNSPLHRANILNSYFTEIGIATAKGAYQGRETVYVVQEFGRPSRKATAVSAQKEETKPVEKISVPTTNDKLALNNVKKETPAVKGAAAEPLEVVAQEDTFIAVKGAEEGSTMPFQEETVGTLASANAAAPTPALLKAAASPRTLLRTAYLALGIFIVLALALMIGVEVKRQHPLHIAYGVSLLALMGILLYSWQGFFFGKLLVV